MNTPVNFEIGKLLKDKGFDTIDCGGYYHICDGYTKGYAYCYSDVNTQEENAILAPTVAETVMWLYENHEMWIDVSLNQFSKPKDLLWMYSIVFTQDCTYSHSPKHYNSPTEAYEAAITYCLENLIQGGNK